MTSLYTLHPPCVSKGTCSWFKDCSVGKQSTDIIYDLPPRNKNIFPLQLLTRAGQGRAKYQLEETSCGVSIWQRQINQQPPQRLEPFLPHPTPWVRDHSRSSASSELPSTNPGLRSCRWPGKNNLASPGGTGELTFRSINILLPLFSSPALLPDSLSGAESRINVVMGGGKNVMVSRGGATEQGNSLCISLPQHLPE